MKWALFVVAGLILLAGLCALIGAMLPRAHHATRKAKFNQTPDAVYAVISGPPGWRSDVKAYGSLPSENGRDRWWEQNGRGEKISFELLEARPPSLRAVRIATPGLPYGGTWTFEIAPAANAGSEVRISEDGEIYNVIFRFMARFIFGYTGSIEGFLRDLGKKFDEPVNIEG
jgi:hypothetical protein